MSFNKIKDESKVGKGELFKPRTFAKDGGKQLELQFTPSTPEDIKRYRRAARLADEERANKKLSAKNRKPEKFEIKDLPFEVKKPNTFRKTFKKVLAGRRKKYLSDKKNDPRWAPALPRYELHEKHADGNFIFGIQTLLSNFSWKELSILINTAAAKEVPTKDFSEAFNIIQTLMHKVMDVEIDDTGVRYVLTNRKRTLAKWDIEVVDYSKCKRRKMKDDDTESGAVTEEPVNETVEKPKKKKVKVEPVEDDSDEDGDDSPKPKRRGKKVVDKKVKKTKKVEKKAKKEKARKVPIELKDGTVIARTTKTRDQTRQTKKEILLQSIPRKGITFKKLLAIAAKADISQAKVEAWVPQLKGWGFLTVE